MLWFDWQVGDSVVTYVQQVGPLSSSSACSSSSPSLRVPLAPSHTGSRTELETLRLLHEITAAQRSRLTAD